MPFTSDWRDVHVAAGCRGLSIAGDALAATTLALALQESGAGGLAVSGIWLAASLPLFVFAPLAGRLVDRFDSRTLLVVVGLLQAAVCAGLAFTHEPVLIIVLLALLATGLAVTQPTFAALVPSMVTLDDLPRASAISQTASTAGALAGPALAGFLVGAFGTRPPLLVDALTYLGVVAAGLLIRTRRGASAPTERTAGAAAPLRWRLREDTLLFTMILALAGVIAGVAGVNVIEVFFVRETLGASTTAYGFITAAWTAGIVLGAWVFARLVRRWVVDDGALVYGVLALLGACCLAVALGAGAPGVAVVVVLWLAGGLGNGGLGVLQNVLMARRVPEAARGRAFAAFNGATQGAAMFGYFVGGLLLERFAPRPLVLVVGLAGLLIVAVAAVPTVRAVRRERAGLVTSAAVG